MNKKTIIATAIIVILAVMGYLLYQVAIEEFENRSAAPYPLAEVQIEDAISPAPSQTMTTPTTKINVSPEFNIEPPVHSRLPMYEFSPSKGFTDEFANGLPEKLGLNTLSNRQDPILGKTIITSRDTKNLIVYIEKGEFTYTDSAPQTVIGSYDLSSDSQLEIFKSRAEKFISSLNLENTAFQYKSHVFVVAKTEHVEITEQLRSANMVQLSYESVVKSLPVIDKDSSLVPNTITVWLNGKGDIAKVRYQAAGTIGKSFGNYELLDENEIKKDLQTANTKAKLVNGDYPIGEPIESVNITSAHIAYLSVENYLVPVYILEANVRTAGNHFGTGYLLLEAIKK